MRVQDVGKIDPAQHFQGCVREKGEPLGVVGIVTFGGGVQIVPVEVTIRADKIDGNLVAKRGGQDLGFFLSSRNGNCHPRSRVPKW